MPKNIAKILNNFIEVLQRNLAMTQRTDGKFILRQEKRMVAALNRVWKQQLDYILRELKTLSRFKDNSVATNSLEEALIDSMLNNIPGRDAMVTAIVAQASLGILKGGTRSVKELKLGQFGINFNLKHPEAVRYLDKKKRLELSNYKGNITDTTNKAVKKIILDGITNGDSYTALASKIEEQAAAGVFSPARSKLIAVMEMGQAYEGGRIMVIDEFKAKHPTRTVEKTWQTVGDSKVRPSHMANELQGWIEFEENFSGTGDKAPPADFGCRCTISYRIP